MRLVRILALIVGALTQRWAEVLGTFALIEFVYIIWSVLTVKE